MRYSQLISLLTFFLLFAIAPGFSAAEAKCAAGGNEVDQAKFGTAAFRGILARARSGNLQGLRDKLRVRSGPKDTRSVTDAELARTKAALDRVKDPYSVSVGASELISKTFSIGDHSTERTLMKLDVQSAGASLTFRMLCAQEYNCLNEASALRWCSLIAE